MVSSRLLRRFSLDPEIKRDLDYISALPKQREEYDEFAQGHWQNTSLVNSSGRPDDTLYVDADRFVPTRLYYECRNIASLIEANFPLSQLRMARIRDLVAGQVIPHRDFAELSTGKHYMRLFIPLETNLDAFHSDEEGVFQMREGELWILDAYQIHAAINFSTSSRKFLCLDFESDDRNPDSICAEMTLDTLGSPHRIKRPPLNQQGKKKIVEALSILLNSDTFSDMVFAVSKVHFRREIAIGACYDWVVEAAEESGQENLCVKAKALRQYMLHQRYLGQRFNFY